MSDPQLQQQAARIDELEMRLSFQEDTLSDLNGVIAKQDAVLMKLTEQIRSLVDKHQDLQHRVEQVGEAPAQERPPHY